jgi:hypothetical protein
MLGMRFILYMDEIGLTKHESFNLFILFGVDGNFVPLICQQN